jgi:hypothetical protein
MHKLISGTFTDLVNTWMEKVPRPMLNEFEEMIQGPWAWSTDGTAKNAFIILHDNHRCSFVDLNDREIVDENSCKW